MDKVTAQETGKGKTCGQPVRLKRTWFPLGGGAAEQNLIHVGDAQDFKRTYSGRGLDLDVVSLGLADQRACDRRADGDLPVLRLSLMITDDLIYHLVAGITIDQRNRGPEYNLIPGQFGNIDDLRAGELVFEFANLKVEQRLAFFGGVKFGIFRQIPMSSRLFDIANVLGTFDALK